MLGWTSKFLLRIVFGYSTLLLLLIGCPLWAQTQEGLSGITIRTSSVEYDENTGKIVASGVSTVEWGEVMASCPSLEVDTKKRELRSEGEIDITWGDYKAKALGLLYRGEENQLFLEKVEGGGKEVTFVAPQVRVDFEKKQLLAEGEVNFKLPPFDLRCTKLTYSFPDKVWTAFEVAISGEGWEGQAQRATFEEGSSFIKILGGARIVKDSHSMVGEEILIYPETRKIQVKGAVINIQP